MQDDRNDRSTDGYSRREALAAVMRYSAGFGGAAATILSADALVSAASAYPAVCATNPNSPACSNSNGNSGNNGNGNGNGNGNNGNGNGNNRIQL